MHIQRPAHRALEHLIPRQCRRDASDAEAPPLPGPEGLGFSPGTEEGEETTTTPPRRTTAPEGVDVVGTGHHQSEISPGLLQPTTLHEAPIRGHPRSNLPRAYERDAKERGEGQQPSEQTTGRPHSQPSPACQPAAQAAKKSGQHPRASPAAEPTPPPNTQGRRPGIHTPQTAAKQRHTGHRPKVE